MPQNNPYAYLVNNPYYSGAPYTPAPVWMQDRLGRAARSAAYYDPSAVEPVQGFFTPTPAFTPASDYVPLPARAPQSWADPYARMPKADGSALEGIRGMLAQVPAQQSGGAATAGGPLHQGSPTFWEGPRSGGSYTNLPASAPTYTNVGAPPPRGSADDTMLRGLQQQYVGANRGFIEPNTAKGWEPYNTGQLPMPQTAQPASAADLANQARKLRSFSYAARQQARRPFAPQSPGRAGGGAVKVSSGVRPARLA